MTVTIDGTATNYSYNNSPITFKIEGGKQYTISFADIENHVSPSSVSYTATAGSSKSLTFNYIELRTEIKIMDINGSLHDISSWTGGSNATGVYFTDGLHSFVIAATDWGKQNMGSSNDNSAWNGQNRSAWGGFNKTVDGVTTTTTSSVAILDFNGSSNTDNMIKYLKSDSGMSGEFSGTPAAEYCRAYSKGCKGVGQWYLPSAGQAQLILDNRSDIESAMTKISGEKFYGDGNYYMWTSTQYNATNAWYVYFGSSRLTNGGKDMGYNVRPVADAI